MSCYYCWQERYAIPDQGTCPYCSRDVCTAPSARDDGDFHGEACGCDSCGLLVCERHLRDHADKEHGGRDPGGCFPTLWAIVSSGGLGGATALLAGKPEEGTGKMTRFLNAVLPRDSLLRVASELPGRLAEVERSPVDAYVHFHPEFFIPTTVERTSALAVRELAAATVGLRLHPERAEWIEKPRHRSAVGDVVREWVAATRHRLDLRYEIPDLERTSARSRTPEIEVARSAVERNRGVFDMHPDELAAWVAAPHAQLADSAAYASVTY